MKYIVVLFIILVYSDAKIINTKQLFNTSLTKVKKMDISNKKTFYGNTTYDETSINDIVLRYDGYIKDLNANSVHKFIKKDEILFSIYSKEVVQTLDELTIALKHNYNNNFIKNIEDRLMLLDINENIIKQIKKTKKTPYYIDVKSKYTGIIINKSINEASYIKSGERLFQLANISSLWVNAEVYQKDLNFIKKDMKASIYIQGLGVYESKVELIHPIVDNKTKTVSVRLLIDNKDLKIFPNMFAKITIMENKKSMLVLPKTAVITKANKHYVFKPLENGEFEPIEIDARRINSNSFEILSSLKENDVVINNALFMLDSDAVTNGLYEEEEQW